MIRLASADRGRLFEVVALCTNNLHVAVRVHVLCALSFFLFKVIRQYWSARNFFFSYTRIGKIQSVNLPKIKHCPYNSYVRSSADKFSHLYFIDFKFLSTKKNSLCKEYELNCAHIVSFQM